MIELMQKSADLVLGVLDFSVFPRLGQNIRSLNSLRGAIRPLATLTADFRRLRKLGQNIRSEYSIINLVRIFDQNIRSLISFFKGSHSTLSDADGRFPTLAEAWSEYSIIKFFKGSHSTFSDADGRFPTLAEDFQRLRKISDACCQAFRTWLCQAVATPCIGEVFGSDTRFGWPPTAQQYGPWRPKV